MRAADDPMTPDDDDANLRAELESVSAELVLERQNNRHLRAWIDKLEMTIARMNRARFGRSSERVDSDQLELLVAEVREAISDLPGDLRTAGYLRMAASVLMES